MVRFHDATGDPKTLTVSQEQGTDDKVYVEFELETHDRSQSRKPILSWEFIRSVQENSTKSVSLGYWRKCYDLDHRMEAIFLARGGAKA